MVALDIFANEALSPQSSALVHNSTSPCFPDDNKQFGVVQSFPRHGTIKLREEAFLQWQHQIRLIVNGYRLTNYVDGTISTSSRFVLDAT